MRGIAGIVPSLVTTYAKLLSKKSFILKTIQGTFTRNVILFEIRAYDSNEKGEWPHQHLFPEIPREGNLEMVKHEIQGWARILSFEVAQRRGSEGEMRATFLCKCKGRVEASAPKRRLTPCLEDARNTKGMRASDSQELCKFL